MFFKKFKNVLYSLDGYSKEVTNILTAVLPRRLNVDETYIFQKYQVSSGQTPESVAEELYKSPHDFWVLLVINDIVNPYLDWAMADEEVEAFTIKKYGNPYGIHHYTWIQTGKYLDEMDEAHWRAQPPEDLPELIHPVTNLEYETDQNLERRQIIVINPRYFSKFVESFQKALEGKE